MNKATGKSSKEKSKKIQSNYKILIIGTTNTGKSSYIRRIINNEFKDDNYPIQELQPINYQYNALSGMQSYFLEFLELERKEWFKPNYIQQASLIMLFFNNDETLLQLQNLYVKYVLPYKLGSSKFILVKSFDDRSIQLNNSQLEEFLKENPMDYVQISAKTNLNIVESLELIIKRIDCWAHSNIFAQKSKEEERKNFKVIMVGRERTGKTCYFQQILGNSYSDFYEPTIYRSFCITSGTLKNQYGLSLTDLGKEEMQGDDFNNHLIETQGIMLFFKDQETFEYIANLYKEQIQTKINQSNQKCLLVQSFSDLKISVDESQLKNFIQENNMKYISISSSENYNIWAAIDMLVKEIDKS